MSVKIPLDKIKVSDENVRTLALEENIDELARSIKAQGLLQPIIVVEGSVSGEYNLIAGQRRYLAIKSLGWKEIEAIVKNKTLTISEMRIISLVENVQRQDIDPQDRSSAIITLCSYGLAYDEISERVGVSETTVRQWAGYDAIYPGIKSLVSEGKLNQNQALGLFRVLSDKPEEEAIEIAKELSTYNSSKDKDRAIKILKSDPDINIDELKKNVLDKQEKQRFNITLSLSSSASTILRKKARDNGVTAGEYAKKIVEEHLELNE